MSDIAMVGECMEQAVVSVKPFAKAQLKLAKHSPEILVGVGIVGMVAGTVLACRATLKAPAALAEAKAKFNYIEQARISGEDGLIEYNKKDRQQDLVAASVQTGVDFVKLYGIPVVLMAAGIFCITKGHSITLKRNAAISSALATLSAGYREYRARVRERFGPEVERDIYYGVKEETKEVTDGNGKTKKTKVTTIAGAASPYAVEFRNETTLAWSPSPEMNMTFLRCQQNYANDILQVRGHMFLNEVHDMLGLPRTSDGSVVGWMKNSEGDNFIDFGLQPLDFYTKNGDMSSPHVVPLDFNVDGVIYDLI